MFNEPERVAQGAPSQAGRWTGLAGTWHQGLDVSFHGGSVYSMPEAAWDRAPDARTEKSRGDSLGSGLLAPQQPGHLQVGHTECRGRRYTPQLEGAARSRVQGKA